MGLNLCALATVAYLVRSRPQPLETVRVVRLPTNSAFVQTGAETLGTRRPSRVKTEAFHWSSVEADDYPTYIRRLRAIGCPEETIRDIVTADVNKLYDQRRDALAATPEPFKFWQTDEQRQITPNLAREQQLRDLEKERRALLRELLGEQLKISAQDVQRLAYLPEDKRQAVAAILARYRDLADNLSLEGPEFLKSEEGQAQLAQYQDQQRAEVAQSLSPQELEDYDLRNSDLARQMRHDLVGFNPSEQEFRTIYRLRQKFADAFGEVRSDDTAAVARRNQAREEFETSLKPILSAARFADYQRSKDAGFR
ncbi:MAG: hypothetical protein HYZ36_03510, partial [Pedosphaera parvula]|nr:hypothetical protein [Pedosphaera parvula]